MWFGVSAVAVALLATVPARAVDREAVARAVDNGVRYLKAHQQADGTWAHDQIGLTALVGLTLLECDVPSDDAQLQKAVTAVRNAAVHTDQTYSIALAILFLDRLGEPVDVALIESLTVRLLAGQHPTGAWAYTCPTLGGADEQRRLSNMVRDRNQRGPDKGVTRPEAGVRTVRDLPREIQGQLEHIQRQRGGHPVQPGLIGDNSNTQFAILGLWVARRHGLPVDGALGLAEKRFRQTVNGDGGWSYVPPSAALPGAIPGPGRGSTPAMTCAGLLGVGMAHGAWNETALRTDPKGKEPAKPAGKPRDPSKDRVVVDALRLLGQWVDGMATGQPGGKLPRVNRANGKFYYFLWSLERMAVAYGIDKVGRTDWYEWGAPILLANQGGDGSWNNGEFSGAPDTCFALLVLRRANLAQDLSRALKTDKDAMQSALRQGGIGGVAPAKGERKPFFDGPPAEDAGSKPADVATTDQATRLGKQLASAGEGKRDQLIKDLRDGKGAAYTDALAAAIPRLEGEAQKKAREALAERLSRMTSETLGVKLEDDDAEVRRAAALAVAMKEDKGHFDKLIELLNDEEVTVTRAAYAALKDLTKQDFGPAKGASRAERAKAVLAWKEWWRTQAEKK
jgi:hypothetical protein